MSTTDCERRCASRSCGSVCERPAGCPGHLRLFCLARGELRARSCQVSCHQDIAADRACSLRMVADFGDTVRAAGGWWHRRLFWEARALAQAPYLEVEAEAAGVRGTGTGCYFDDVVHDLLGLAGD